MRHVRLFLSLVFAILLPASLSAKNVALVIGNSAYQSVSLLPNPTNDARAISEALRLQGFDVTLALDIDRPTWHAVLRDFRDKADDAEMALVYYAGHGIEVSGINYLVPTDAVLLDERDAEGELVTVDSILDQISGAKRMKMVVLDACRDNPFAKKMKSSKRGRNVGRGLGETEADGDTLIAYAAAAGAIALDGESGGNSPFTTALLSAIQGPPMDVRRLLGSVRDKMRKTAPDAEPFLYASLGGGEYVINPHSQFSAEPSPENADNGTNDPRIFRDFLAADQIGTVEAWNSFLVKYTEQGTSEVYHAALGKRNDLVTGRTLPNVTVESAAAAPPLPETRKQAVLNMQTFLKDRNCYRSRLDGLWGPGTSRGIKLFADRAKILVDMPSRPGLEDLAKALQLLSADPETKCPAPPVTTAHAPKPNKPSGSTSGTAKTPTAPAAKPEAPAPNCFSFEGQNFCN